MIIQKPVVVHQVSRVQTDLAQHLFAEDPLVPHVMQCKTHPRVAHAKGLVHFVKQHWHQRRLPVVAVDNVRMLVRFEHELQRRPAEKGEAFPVVMVPVKHAPVEKIAVGVRIDEKAFQAIHPAGIHVAMHPLVVIRHPQVAIALGQPCDAVVAHAIILGQDDFNRVSAEGEFLREPVDDVPKTADFSRRRALR